MEVRTLAGDELAIDAADQIEKWIGDGVHPSAIAVLSRVNSSLIPVKASLAGRNVPTNNLLTSESLNRTAVRALFAWMRLAMEPERMRTGDVIEAIRRPSRGLTTVARELLNNRATSLQDLASAGSRLDAKQAARWNDFMHDLERSIDVADEGSSGTLVRLLTDDIGLGSSAQTLDSGRTSATRSHHDDLVAVRRATGLHDDVSDFIPWLQAAVDGRSSPDGVTLSSVHRVKGMEWSRVIVFGADRGSMPHDLATDREEERRVFHVAITRAKDHALILADGARPSRFLKELDGSAKPDVDRPVAISPARRRPSSTVMMPLIGDRVSLRGGLKGLITAKTENSIEVQIGTGAEIVAAIADIVAVDRMPPGDSDPDLVEALRDWRRTKCGELGVPAYVVLHDATIDEIAARAPASERELSIISGIGPSKLEHYGDELLAIVDGLN